MIKRLTNVVAFAGVAWAASWFTRDLAYVCICGILALMIAVIPVMLIQYLCANDPVWIRLLARHVVGVLITCAVGVILGKAIAIVAFAPDDYDLSDFAQKKTLVAIAVIVGMFVSARVFKRWQRVETRRVHRAALLAERRTRT